jgi:MFS family permease
MKTAKQLLLFNFTVNVLDGGFFGLALGFASFGTVIPLFINTMAPAAILVGLIPAIHAMGWQLPQIFTIGMVSRQTHYKPLTLKMTLHERLPFLGMAVIAWFVKPLGPAVAVILIFAMIIWQGLGGGVTAIAWQSLVGRVIPPKLRSTFFGVQAAAMSLFTAGGALISGIILDRLSMPLNFTLCFCFAVVALILSWVMLALTIEPRDPQNEDASARGELDSGPGRGGQQHNLKQILRRNGNFRWYLVVRVLSQFATMGFAFYIIYLVKGYDISKTTAGVMTSVMMVAQIIANPIMGWLGDHWSHRGVMGIGLIATVLSTAMAWLAPSFGWFYGVVALTGIANVAIWIVAMAMTMEFGDEAERPAYIGLSNTLVAPASMVAPIFGGWLADRASYPTTFWVSACFGLLAVVVLFLRLKDPAAERRAGS